MLENRFVVLDCFFLGSSHLEESQGDEHSEQQHKTITQLTGQSFINASTVHLFSLLGSWIILYISLCVMHQHTCQYCQTAWICEYAKKKWDNGVHDCPPPPYPAILTAQTPLCSQPRERRIPKTQMLVEREKEVCRLFQWGMGGGRGIKSLSTSVTS